MKKATILVALVTMMAMPAYAAKVDAPSAVLGSALDCSGAQSATCGDVLIGTVGTTPGGPIEYGCSTLDYDGCTEAIYEICVAADDQLTVDMTYTHDGTLNDLDLFLLGSCAEADCLDSSTDTSGTETVTAAVTAGTYYAVVDGWSVSGVGRCDGSGHTVTVSCGSPCTPVSVDETTWGQIKGQYR